MVKSRLARVFDRREKVSRDRDTARENINPEGNEFGSVGRRETTAAQIGIED